MTSLFNSCTYEVDGKFNTYIYKTDKSGNLHCVFALTFTNITKMMAFFRILIRRDDIDFIPVKSNQELVDQFNAADYKEYINGGGIVVVTGTGSLHLEFANMSDATITKMIRYIVCKNIIDIPVAFLPELKLETLFP